MDQWSDSALKAWYYALLGAGVLIGAWLNIEPHACPVPKALLTSENAAPPPCFEFWLNRYQTLAGATVAVVAAGLAWISVQRQVEVAREQVKSAVGDLLPDFSVRQTPVLRGASMLVAMLEVANLNRREIWLRRIEIIAPTDARAVFGRVDADPDMGRVRGAWNNSVFETDYRVPGTPPASGQTSTVNFSLAMALNENWQLGTPERPRVKLRLRISYDIMGHRAEPGVAEVECNLRRDF